MEKKLKIEKKKYPKTDFHLVRKKDINFAIIKTIK